MRLKGKIRNEMVLLFGGGKEKNICLPLPEQTRDFEIIEKLEIKI